MAIPASRPALPSGSAQARVVAPGGQQRLEPRGQIRLRAGARAPPRRSSRPGSHGRPRPASTRRTSPPGPRARPARRIRPRRGVQAMAHRRAHQGVPGRVELDLVDPVARASRGCAAPAGSRSPAGPAAGCPPRRPGGRGHARSRGGPGRALPAERGQQRRVVGHVMPGQRRHLVQHLVRPVRAGRRGHRAASRSLPISMRYPRPARPPCPRIAAWPPRTAHRMPRPPPAPRRAPPETAAAPARSEDAVDLVGEAPGGEQVGRDHHGRRAAPQQRGHRLGRIAGGPPAA